MTDQEITEIIVTKVMGWHRRWPWNIWFNEDGSYGGDMPFAPLTSDSDCMMAWDKFSEDHYAELTRLGGGDWETDNGTSIIYNSDRRRAMCECIVRTVG